MLMMVGMARRQISFSTGWVVMRMRFSSFAALLLCSCSLTVFPPFLFSVQCSEFCVQRTGDKKSVSPVL